MKLCRLLDHYNIKLLNKKNGNLIRPFLLMSVVVCSLFGKFWLFDLFWHFLSYSLEYRRRGGGVALIQCSQRDTSVTPAKAAFPKNFYLRRKGDYSSRDNLLENHFRHLKLYLNPPSWLARSHCHMCIFWKAKGWSFEDWRLAYLSGFTTREFTAKEDLNPTKQVFLLNLRLRLAQKPKI